MDLSLTLSIAQIVLSSFLLGLYVGRWHTKRQIEKKAKKEAQGERAPTEKN